MTDEQQFEKWWGEAPTELNRVGSDDNQKVLSMWVWQAWLASAKAEREECAKACEDADFGNCWTDDSEYDSGMLQGAQVCADAIRNRSNEGK